MTSYTETSMRIHTNTLSDGSRACDVLLDIDGHTVRLACCDHDAAQTLLDALRGCTSWTDIELAPAAQEALDAVLDWHRADLDGGRSPADLRSQAAGRLSLAGASYVEALRQQRLRDTITGLPSRRAAARLTIVGGSDAPRS
jgi:hypothetical protein